MIDRLGGTELSAIRAWPDLGMISRGLQARAGFAERGGLTREATFHRLGGYWTQLIILAMLTLLGGWLRFQAIGFGLPDKFRPDEEYLVSRALGFEKDWNPHFAIYPAAQMYVQHGALWLYATVSGYRGHFRDAYSADGQRLAYLIARGTSAAFGTITVPALYFAVRSSFGGGAALATAAIWSCATLPVEESKYATSDTAAAFWVAISIAMLLGIAATAADKAYVGAGFFAGIAAATKYPAAVVLFGVMAAHFEARRREGRSIWLWFCDARILMCGCSTVIAFLGATPYFVIDWAQTVNDYRYQQGFIVNGVGNWQTTVGLRWLMLHAMPVSFGAPLQALFLASWIWAVIRRKPGTLSLLTFVTVALAGMVYSNYVFYRYLLIPMIAMSILAGAFIVDAAATLSSYVGNPVATGVAAIALGVLLAPSVINDASLNRLLSQTDTRTLARVWIEAHIALGSSIACTQSTTPYGKPQLPDNYRIAPFEDIDILRAKGIHWVLSDSFPPLAYYSEGPSSIEFSKLNSRAELMFDVNPIRARTPVPVFDPADAFYVPLRRASSMTRPGPRIRIWRVK